MTDWEAYADEMVHTPQSYFDEYPQRERIERMCDRLGPPEWTVLDVGASDGFTSWVFAQAGHKVVACDISARRVERIQQLYGIEAHVVAGEALPYGDGAFDVVVLGEILEHTENPGRLFAEACRVAKERVVISIPLNGWADPTHQWRISVETLGSINLREPTKGQQCVLTWQKGRCWDDSPNPQGYFQRDEKWQRQFVAEMVPVTRLWEGRNVSTAVDDGLESGDPGVGEGGG